MNIKLLFLPSLVLSSAANTGIFDLLEENQPFKCCREDAVNALIEALRDNALSRISVSPENSIFFKIKSRQFKLASLMFRLQIIHGKSCDV